MARKGHRILIARALRETALRSPASSKKRRVFSNILLFVVFQPSHRKVERSVSRVHGGFVGGVQGVGFAALLLV